MSTLPEAEKTHQATQQEGLETTMPPHRVSHLHVILENAGRELGEEEQILLGRLLSDFDQPKKVDVIHIFGRAKGDEAGPMSRAAELYQQGYTSKILIPGSKGETWAGNMQANWENYFAGTNEGTAWAGRKTWKDKLVDKYGVNETDVHYSQVPFNTRLDAEALLQFARRYYMRDLAIVAQPHQIERAFLSTVATMRDRKTWFNVWAVVPENTDWMEIVPGSQGKDPKPRIEDIAPEMKRVLAYAPKDVASIEEGLDYLKRRDEGDFAHPRF